MKVTKAQTQHNKDALLQAAGSLFKEHGIDGIGVADICKQAGLTHGALYKHFNDKQDLAAQSFSHVFREGFDRVRQVRPGEQLSLQKFLDSYLSAEIRDDLRKGCPLVSTACETARQGDAVSQSFLRAFIELRSAVTDVLPIGGRGGDRAQVATTVVAVMVGAMAISRAIAKADKNLADEVLTQTRSVLECLSSPST